MHQQKTGTGTGPNREPANLADLGVAAAATAIRAGEISSQSYSAALLDRAQRYSDLNSFVAIDESAVVAAATDADKARRAGLDGPLLGVPLGVKDSYLTSGLPTTLGTGILTGFVPAEDADVVAAVRRAGGLVLGKNNLVEMSYGLTGSNIHHGQVKNPYAFDHISGGSSSGSAASVAARIVPASLGGDTVGSIRVPAALCGVVGFRPTVGRWSRSGVAPISRTLDTTGVLARSVEDCALIDQVVTGANRGLSARSDLTATKFAYAPRQYLELIEPQIERCFRTVVERLRDAGAQVVEIDLGQEFTRIAERSTWNIFFHETIHTIPEFLRLHGVPASFGDIYDQLEPAIKDAWSQAVLPDGPDFVSAETYQTAISIGRPELQYRYSSIFSQTGIDAFLCPTTPCAAPLINDQTAFPIADRMVSQLTLAKNTAPTSGAGVPGISIPMGLTDQGLPMGIEIDGAHHRDRAVLDIARRVEVAIGATPAPR